ncbi:unnamed protein product [Blepharisma stoltei]|uniref:Kelch motif family protein n=1 Tax=Blepharisma stoltei TaxID=1481888 RepID=A0AAU9J1X8_9CILI|nr:unnamed protein product [Blepharisma stoltei]
MMIEKESTLITFVPKSKQCIVTNVRNLESRKLVIPELENIGSLSEELNSLCLLNDNRAFCYSTRINGEQPGQIFIIDYVNRNIERRPDSQRISYGARGIFYQETDSVYIFGGVLSKSAFKYSLRSENWTELSSMEAESHTCSCALFGDNIVYSGYLHTNLYIYSISNDCHYAFRSSEEYPSIPNLTQNSAKIVTVNSNRIFIIDALGFIYESHECSASEWTILAKSRINYGYLMSYIFPYNKSIYFVIQNALYEFCFGTNIGDKRVRLKIQDISKIEENSIENDKKEKEEEDKRIN